MYQSARLLGVMGVFLWFLFLNRFLYIPFFGMRECHVRTVLFRLVKRDHSTEFFNSSLFGQSTVGVHSSTRFLSSNNYFYILSSNTL